MKRAQTIALIAIVIPSFALAALPTTVDGVAELLNKIAGHLFDFAMIVGIICVLWAAFQYMTAGGSSEKVGDANKIMLYAVIGLAVALLASGVPTIIDNFLVQ
jgi:hypothetical protein